MSAFLGPIHHWLFKKIQFQNDLTDEILASFDDARELNLFAKLEEQYGELEQSPLEDIIDGTNIHGWLQERVSLVEYRLADAVTSILKQDKGAMSRLEKLAFDFGGENAPPDIQTAKAWFAFLNDTLLDGMPCDRANEVLSASDRETVWKRVHCVHESYWDEVDGDIGNYYILRDALIDGFLSGSPFVYEKSAGDTFKLKRGA